MSIGKNGIRQPVVVRMNGNRYELLSGTRRYRAAVAAGHKTVPCVVLEIDDEETEIYMLQEYIVRRELDFVEEAAALDKLRSYYNISQYELSELVGLTQSTVANKLRLLKMPEHLLDAAKSGGLTERHCRAALRLPTTQLMARAITRMIADDMNVAEADEFVSRMMPEPDISELRNITLPSALMGPASQTKNSIYKEPATPKPAEATSIHTKPLNAHLDYRFYYNTIMRGAETMKQSGYCVSVNSQESEEEVLLTVAIPKRARRG